MAIQTYYMGPSGGTGGKLIDPRQPSDQPEQLNAVSNFAGLLGDLYLKPDCHIGEIIINAGDDINSLTVSYSGTNDIPYGSYKMGGSGGAESIIQFSSGEYITQVVGWYGKYVSNFTFWTNKNSYPSYGTSAPVNFEYSAPPGYEIIGFWGGAGKYVDRIGVVIRLLVDSSGR